MKKLRVAICYDPPKVSAGERTVKIFEKLGFIRDYLLKLGHMAIDVPHRINPEVTAENIKKYAPDVIWNLFETYNGRRDESYLGAMLLDNTGIPYTGCSAQSILFSADIVILKQILREAGANVPLSYAIGEPFIPGKWVLRPQSGAGGVEELIVSVRTEKELQNSILSMPLEYNIIAEEYVEGRNFIVFILDQGKGAKAFLVSEMKNGVPVYNHSSYDMDNIDKMMRSADIISSILDIKGFAHMGFCLGRQSRMWVTGVTMNPSINKKSLFTSACSHSGIEAVEMIEYILNAAFR